MSETASRDAALERGAGYVDEGHFEAELGRRVAVRTESQKAPDSLPELDRYLRGEMIPAFEAMGFTCETYDNPVDGLGPVLLASRIEDPALPTVLGYGHGDVIRGLEDRWTQGRGPWDLVRDGDRLYGRGTADNKGQHTINMAALRTVLETRGRLGFNAKMLIEMGEEAGSRGLREILEANRSAFAADVFIGSDGPRVRPDQLTVTLGARGVRNFDLVCKLREGGHHSGNWGGLLANPGIVLAHALAAIVDSNGAIQIPEWRPRITEEVRALLRGIEPDPGESGVRIDRDWGEPDLTPAEKVYAGSSFNVLTFETGTPSKPVNAIPPKAWAHCQLRYGAGIDDDDVVPALRRHLSQRGFDRVEVRAPHAANSGGFPAAYTAPGHPWSQWVRSSLARTLGTEPAVLPGMGGSICNDLFTDLLGLPAIWLPHSYAGCQQHAPDEHVLMPVCRSAMQVMTGLYWDLGSGETPS